MLINTDEHPIFVSIAYYVFFLSLGSILRALIRRFVSRKYQKYWLDLVTTLSVLGCSLENGHVRQEYGYGGYIAVLYLLVTWYSLTLLDSNPNPVYNVVSYAQGQIGIGRALWLTTAQIIGALLCYRIAVVFWGFGLCPNHRKRFGTLDCMTDLSVSTFVGFLLESVGTAFDVFLSLSVFTNAPVIEVAVKCLTMCLLTAAAVHLTGFYLNPMNASNQTIGCPGTSIHTHLLVYWIGPCVFAYITTVLQPRLYQFIRGNRADSENAEWDKVE